MQLPNRSRSWACLCYDDLTLSYLVALLKQHHLSGYISPLHIPSLNYVADEDDLQKKPHYHILIVMPRGETLSRSLICRICETVNIPLPVAVTSITAYARYLTHLDDKDKQQIFYGSKVETFGCPLAYSSIILTNESLTENLLSIIANDDIKSFQYFVKTAYSINPDYLPFIMRNSYFFKSFIKD